VLFTLLFSVSACEQPANVQTLDEDEQEEVKVDCSSSDVQACCTALANKSEDGVNLQLIETASGKTALVIAATFTDHRIEITGISETPPQPGPSPRTLVYQVEVARSSDPTFDNGGNAMFSTLIDLSNYDRQQDSIEIILPMPDGQNNGTARRKIRGLMADEQ
jgi:hypothetical protein